MKKFIAFLLACMMLMSTTAFAASAYTPLVLDEKTTLPHTLTLDLNKINELYYNITYSFEVSENVEIVAPEGLDATMAVSGSPEIADITYGPSDFKNESGSYDQVTKNIVVDWKGVTFNEPGVYRWTVTKDADDTAVDQYPDSNGDSKDFEASNTTPEFYLTVVVSDNGGSLNKTIYITPSTDLEAQKMTSINDTFPAQTVDLTVAKQVSGTQASRDQYFKFTVSLEVPTNVNEREYTIAGAGTTFDTTTAITAYNPTSYTNNTSFKVSGIGETKTVSFDLWLKHGQSFKILDLPYGTEYFIVESSNDGYEVAATADNNGDTTDFTYTKAEYKSSDISLQKDTTVTYTNSKNTPVVTGIDLQTGAPIMGLMMAAAMMLMMAINKRKEAAE